MKYYTILILPPPKHIHTEVLIFRKNITYRFLMFTHSLKLDGLLFIWQL